MRTPEDLIRATGVPFSPEQLDAITAPLAPGVIIAGAGTGKTTVMAARVVWLVGTGQVRPDEVLGLTFTRKAAGELGDRVIRALGNAGLDGWGPDAQAPTVSTYDAFAARLVQEHGLRAGLDDAPTLVTGAASFQVMDQVVAAAPGPFPTLAQYGRATVVERALDLANTMRANLVGAGEVRAWNARAEQRFLDAPGHGRDGARPYRSMLKAAERCSERGELLTLVEAHEVRKHELGVVEYADQMATAARLAREVPAVAQALRDRFAVVLLDEYQDTSSAQAGLLTALFAGHPVTAVGDPYQAIYGWRGAAASNILEFEDGFGRARRDTLTVNRRSRTRILDVGNALASTVPGGDGVTLRAPADTPSGRVETVRFDTEEEELDFVADQVLALEGTCRWSAVAVLSRRRSTLAPLHQRLTARGVPTEIVGLGGLLWLPEIVPVVQMLRLLADPLDNAALGTLLTAAGWRIPLTDLARLGRHARSLVDSEDEEPSLLEALMHPPDGLSEQGTTRIGHFLAAWERLRRHVTAPVDELLPRVIRALGVEEELRADGRDVSQLAAFVRACVDRPLVGGDATLGGLVAYLQVEAEQAEGLEQAQVSDADSVKLVTMHAAKGLEWTHVFLPCLVEGVFPAPFRGDHWVNKAAMLPGPLRGDAHAVAQLEEWTNDGLGAYVDALKDEHRASEDRLAYVAATRAKERLVATCHRWGTGLKRERAASDHFTTIERFAAEDGRALDRTTDAECPTPTTDLPVAWPAPPDPDRHDERLRAAALVEDATGHGDAWALESVQLAPDEERRLEEWDAAIAHVLARPGTDELRLPPGLSASQLMLLRRDPQALAAQLVRRMPRRPAASARLGTSFHEWVERRFALPAGFDEFEPQPPPLAELVEAFERGRFADLAPIAVEVPFAMVVGAFQLRGRIDAVYRWEGEFDELVVDWKTSNAPADELQLAVYRRAWAEARGLPLDRVGAAFYHVRQDRLVVADADPGSVELALRLQGRG